MRSIVYVIVPLTLDDLWDALVDSTTSASSSTIFQASSRLRSARPPFS